MPIYNGSDLSQKHLVMLYSDNIKEATVNNAVSTLMKCQSQLKIKVDKIEEFAIGRYRDKRELQKLLEKSVIGYLQGEDIHP